ncbi:hypothetical protein RDABS01_024168 [Bienertia sinuspersici]
MIPIIFVSLLILSPFFSKECSSQEPLPQAPAVYVFGDSLLDAGNNNNHTLFAKANYRPYGINFPTGRATGRFTDGKTFADFIAGYLGLPFPIAYRGKRDTILQTGYTYASGGCGILPRTGINLGCLSMDRQLELFQETKDKELTPFYQSELSEYLADSIFIVWAGSNDYLLNYFRGRTPDFYNKSEEFAQHLVDGLSDKLKILHDKGARKIVVLELGPLGCLPVYRKNNNENATWCDESKNVNATMFNARLAPMIQDLTSAYPDSYFTLGKLYDLSDDVFKHPSNYGKVWGNLPCFPLLKPCSNPEEYLFWDGAHPTQASHQLLATPCFSGSDVCVPNNIQQLVQLKAKTASLHTAA